MDKFSKVVGQKIGIEPKMRKSKEASRIEIFKAHVNSLLDDFITIRYYGSARRDILLDTSKITGKEQFIDALLDFLINFNLDEKIKLLESLKSESRDWKVIDKKISDLEDSISELNMLNKNDRIVNKFKVLLDTYGKDDRFEIILEKMVSGVNNYEDAKIFSEISSKIKENYKFYQYPDRLLDMIESKYLNKFRDIDFRENGNFN